MAWDGGRKPGRTALEDRQALEAAQSSVALVDDDFPADSTTSGVIVLGGGSVAGVFEADGDVDWFAITLEAGQSIALQGPEALASIMFFDALGNPLAVDFFRVFDSGAGTQAAGFTASAAGTYYVSVSGAAGSYTLNAQLSAGNPNDVSAFPVITTGVAGNLTTPGEVRWYQVALDAGETLQLASYSGNPFYVEPVFYDAFGRQLTGAGEFTQRYFTAPESGTYYVAFSSAAVPQAYSYSALVFTDDYADSVNGHGSDVEPIGVLTVDGPAQSGVIETTADSDIFAISLTAGQSIEVFAPWWMGIGMPTDGAIQFFDSAGNPVEVDFFNVFSGYSTGHTQSAGITATATGTYYVAVTYGGTNAPYQLNAVTLNGPHPMDVGTFETLVDGERAQGAFGGDAGWFAVELQAGETVAVNADGAFYDVYGNGLQASDVVDLTNDWFTYFTAATDGIYYFHVQDDVDDFVFDFETHIYFDDAPDWSPEPGLPTYEAYPVLDSSGDQFEASTEVYGDRDYFAVSLAAGEAVRVRVEFTGLHTMSGQVLVIGPDGQQYIGQLESADGSEILFTAPAAGTYYVRVDGLYRYIGDYTVTLTAAEPSDAYTGVPGIMPAPPARPAIAPLTETTAASSSETYTVGSGTVLYGYNIDDDDFFAPYGSPIIHTTRTLNNSGQIYSYADEYVGFGVTAVTADRLINSGLIVAENGFLYRGAGTLRQQTVAVYLGDGVDGVSLDNSGQIIAVGTQNNAAAIASGAQPTLQNSGLIAAHATWSANDPTQSGGAFTISLSNGGTIINQLGGQIIAQGDSSATAIGTSQWSINVTNYGLIEAQTQGEHAVSRGISAAPTSSTSTAGGVVHNYGTVRADLAIYGNLNVFNYAGGVIDGDITLFHVPNGINTGAHTITNQGTINGDIDTGVGHDTFTNTGGQVNGSVDLSYGNDTYVGGDHTDAVVGGHGDDQLSGAGGDDLLLGSYGDDIITGGAGNDGMYGEIGDDRLITAGGDVASGGAGDDQFETSDYTFASIAGGAGFDTWVLPAGARTLDLSLVAASNRVSGIEAIDLAGAQTLVVRPEDIAVLSGAAGALYVSGEGANNVYLAGAWTAGAQVVRDGVSFTTYTLGAATVFVQSGITTTIGVAPPTGGGLDVAAAGPAALAPGAVAGVDLSPAIISEPHRVIDQFVIGVDEVWANETGAAALTAFELIGPTLINYGTISVTGALHPHIGSPWGFGASGVATGLHLLHIDSFDNHGSIVVTAIQDGLATGVVGSARYGVVNGPTGIIHAYAEAGMAIAFDGFGGSIGWGDWSIENAGDIYAYSETGFAIAVSERNGSYILNDGVIEADGGDGAIAVDLSNGGDGVWNRGQIIAYAPLTSTYFSYGIISDGHSVIVNDGLIAAEIAIDLISRYQEAVSVTNTGTIVGDIQHRQPSSIALGRATIINSGDIFGSIYLFESLRTNEINNTGYIEGDIFFGGGDDLYEGGGRLVGAIAAGGGNDTLRGGAFADAFMGEAGADLLSGGGGVDLALYSVASSAATWSRNIDGSWTVSAGADGVDTLISMERLEFTDRTVVLDNAQRTFSGNGTSDLLFRNATHGTVVIWDVTGGVQNSATVAGGAPADWTIIGTGDLNGDGKDDLIWRHDAGGVAGWLMNGVSATSIAMVGGAPEEWQVAGLGDFNFDGKDDFVWHNTDTGAIAVWLMDGLTSTSQAIISGAPLDWNVAAIADFDGDGRDDILLRNDDGTLARWTTDGVTQTSASIVGGAPAEWQVAGTGDFDGDGRADILLHNTSDGAIALWQMNGSTQLSANIIGAAPTAWHVAQIGDFSGDGKDDILLRHTDGTLALWTMNGTNVANVSIFNGVPTEWGLI